jgi:hypothetical protein
MSYTHMSQRKDERNLSDNRTLTETLNRARYDSGKTLDVVAEALHVRRSYLTDALNEGRVEVLQFQARHIVPFCEATGSVLPLAWMADRLGYVLVKREHADTASDVLHETLDVSSVAGRLSERVREATADGTLSAIERAEIIEMSRRVQREAADVERAADAAGKKERA